MPKVVASLHNVRANARMHATPASRGHQAPWTEVNMKETKTTPPVAPKNQIKVELRRLERLETTSACRDMHCG
jgi:hypothetical protein